MENLKLTNFHNHCDYCDGKESIESHVKSAIDKGVISLGFTSHSPVPFENVWSMKHEHLEGYLNEISQAQKKYSGQIEIYKSLEIDYIPNIITPTDSFIKDLKLDYSLGSVHFVGAFENGDPWEIDGLHSRFLEGLHQIYHGDIRFVISKYYELIRKMVRECCPNVIGHIDKIKMQNRGLWNEADKWYQEEIMHTLEEIKSSKAIIEINTRSLYKNVCPEAYPGIETLKKIHELKIPIQVNSDAHHPREIIAGFPDIWPALLSIGFKNLGILRNNEWITVKIDKIGLKM